MARSYWRDACAPIIRYVITTNPGATEKELRQLISEKYPFGERSMHPYKIWLSELNNQLDQHFGRNKKKKKTETDPSQLDLFKPAKPTKKK